MLFNPFLEGVVLVVLGVACMIFGKIYTLSGLDQAGNIMMGIGIGYFGKTAVETNNVVKAVSMTPGIKP